MKKESNEPINVIRIKESDLKKYRPLKNDETLETSDLIYLIDDKYIEMGHASKLLNHKANKDIKAFRKK